MAEAVEEEVKSQGLNQTLKDLFGGAVGGVAQVLIGMNFSLRLCVPFSTGDWWMQKRDNFSRPVDNGLWNLLKLSIIY